MKFLFKTNLKCSGCVDKLSTHLNKNKDITLWNADLDSDDKVLTIESEKMEPEKLKQIIEEAGFKASLFG